MWRSDGLYFIHADHLNTPRAILDQANRVVWLWKAEPFGSLGATNDPDGDSVKFFYNLRFPGQYFDSETGLFYNYFRDYDPRSGRYMSSDPIGLGGGLNSYLYALADPLRFTDPMGLRTAVVINGPTAGNPIGHTAIALPGTGVFSYGNNAYGMNLSDYVMREAPRRDTAIIIIDTTPDQEARILDYLKGLPRDGLQWWPDNCAERTSGALAAGGMRNPWSIFPSSSWPDEVMAQAEFWRQALGGSVVSIPQNSLSAPSVLMEFDRR